MPLEGFYCKDSVKIKTADCISKCRMSRRCLTLPTLMYLGREYEWKGKPSTTQLLNPTRISWLKIKKPYYIEPHSRAFALLGSNHHATLEIFAKLAGLTSEYKIDGEVSGILDLLEPDSENEGMFILSDYKTWGAYSVKKALNNNITEISMQLNHYRYKIEQSKSLEEALGNTVKISRIQAQVTVRDGGTFAARNLGINERMLMIDIPIIDNKIISEYFNGKASELLEALKRDNLPKVCNSEENWNWKRCKNKFCEVYMHCPEGQKINIKRHRND